MILQALVGYTDLAVYAVRVGSATTGTKKGALEIMERGNAVAGCVATQAAVFALLDY